MGVGGLLGNSVMCPGGNAEGLRWEGSWVSLVPSLALPAGLGLPQVILTHNKSASYMGPQASNGICRQFSNVKEHNGKSI